MRGYLILARIGFYCFLRYYLHINDAFLNVVNPFNRHFSHMQGQLAFACNYKSNKMYGHYHN